MGKVCSCCRSESTPESDKAEMLNYCHLVFQWIFTSVNCSLRHDIYKWFCCTNTHPRAWIGNQDDKTNHWTQWNKTSLGQCSSTHFKTNNRYSCCQGSHDSSTSSIFSRLGTMRLLSFWAHKTITYGEAVWIQWWNCFCNYRDFSGFGNERLYGVMEEWKNRLRTVIENHGEYYIK